MKGFFENLGMGLKAICHEVKNESASSGDKDSNQN
jgi:hypothetical protein